MPSFHAQWTVLSHGPLEELSDNLWRVEGELPKMALKRVMTVARTRDGRLLLHSPICLQEEQQARLLALGQPALLVVPNGWHRLDAPAYKARFPELRVYCPQGARKRVEKALAVDGDLSQLPPDPTVRMEHLDGVERREGVLLVGSGDGGTSLVFNDAIFNQPHLPGFEGLVMRLLGSTGGPRVTRIGRWFLISDRKALSAHLQRLAETPDLRRIVVSHGDVIDRDPAGVLRRVAAGLSRQPPARPAA